MFRAKTENTKFYCRKENCIVDGCPMGDQLTDCPLRIDCQAWKEVIFSSVGPKVIPPRA